MTWAKEYWALCQEQGADPAVGLDAVSFARIVERPDVKHESGGYPTEELRGLLARLGEDRKGQQLPMTWTTATPPTEPPGRWRLPPPSGGRSYLVGPPAEPQRLRL